MKAKYKRKWIKALHSRKRKQTFGCLRDEDGFCCLGVLCDVVKGELGEDWLRRPGSTESSFMAESGVLPDTVIALVGMDALHGFSNAKSGEYLDHKRRLRNLAADNDSGKSFKQIANIIERRF